MSRQHRQTLPTILFEIGKLIGSAESLGGLLTQVSRLVTQLVNARACSILILETPIVVDGIHIGVRISAGVAQAVDSETTGELIRRADVALYAAKKAGRNRVVAADCPTT